MPENNVQLSLYKQLILELNEAGVSEQQLHKEAETLIAKLPASPPEQAAALEGMLRMETAVKLSGDDSLFLKVGQQVGIESYNTLGFALMSCANLRDAITLLLRYDKLFFQPIWTPYKTDGGLLLRINLETGSPKQQQLFTELAFSMLSKTSSALYRGRVEGAEIHLAYPAPAHKDYYQKAILAEISFNREFSQLYVPDSALDIPVRTANISEHIVFKQQCEEMLRSLNEVGETTSALRRVLIQSAGDFPDIAQVADHLHVSERTLRRRLKNEATSFRDILDEIRNLLAREYLVKTSLTVAEIAHLLDFSEAVHFRRAFVRWNSITPGDYRQTQTPEQQ